MLFADDAIIVFTSPGSLERIKVIMHVAGQWGLLVSKPRMNIMRIFAKGMQECSFTVDVARMVFNQKKEFVYLGAKIFEDGSIEGDINRRVQHAHDCFRCTSQAVIDSRMAPLDLKKVRLRQAEIVETLLYGFVA